MLNITRALFLAMVAHAQTAAATRLRKLQTCLSFNGAPCPSCWMGDCFEHDQPICEQMGGVFCGATTPVTPVSGCTDSSSCNFDDAATVDDGKCVHAEPGFDCDGCAAGEAWSPSLETCEQLPFGCSPACFPGYMNTYRSETKVCSIHICAWCDECGVTRCSGPAVIDGCANPTACNYNKCSSGGGACVGNGGLAADGNECGRRGCTDSAASNFDESAIFDDQTCQYPLPGGCTESSACNYDPLARADDGSCTYPADKWHTCRDGACVGVAVWSEVAQACQARYARVVAGYNCEGSGYEPIDSKKGCRDANMFINNGADAPWSGPGAEAPYNISGGCHETRLSHCGATRYSCGYLFQGTEGGKPHPCDSIHPCLCRRPALQLPAATTTSEPSTTTQVPEPTHSQHTPTATTTAVALTTTGTAARIRCGGQGRKIKLACKKCKRYAASCATGALTRREQKQCAKKQKQCAAGSKKVKKRCLKKRQRCIERGFL